MRKFVPEFEKHRKDLRGHHYFPSYENIWVNDTGAITHVTKNCCLNVFLGTMVDNLMIEFIELQDGSYSRGPVDIPVGEADDSNYYLSPTFKFEQVSFA